MVDGKEIALGTQVFRIKAVPDPTPSINGQKSGSYSKNDLLSLGNIVVDLVDFDFDDYEFTVISYQVQTTIGGFGNTVENVGNKFNAQVIKNINASKRGQSFYFSNIRVREPNGDERTLDAILKAEIK